MPLNPDRLFPIEPEARGIARELYARVKDLPILSPHGHTEPRWYAENQPFSDPVSLFVRPDHYIFRMLYSQGISLEQLGVPDKHGVVHNTDTLIGTDGFAGIKTGSMDASGGCFMFVSKRSAGDLYGVVLGQQGHNLIDAGLYAAKQLADHVAA